MPRVCTVCVHGAHQSIDKALVSATPYRRIAQQYGVSENALYRHHDEHLPLKLVKAHEAKEVAEADSLLDQVQMLRDRALGILDTAEQSGDLKNALGGIREARACLELLAELEGKISRQPINILVAPEWVELRVVILAALGSFPEARQAVVQAINERAG
jgi:hypothetical protein